MSLEEAKEQIKNFTERFEPSYETLVYHAALPFVLTPELLNYLRIEFLGEEVPWIAEADFLLSDLCNPVGYELYAMKADIRAYALKQLPLGKKRAIARRLINYVQYLAQNNAFFSKQQLKTQQWAAIIYLQEKQEDAIKEFTEALNLCVSDAQKKQIAQIIKDLELEIRNHSELVEFAEQVTDVLRSCVLPVSSKEDSGNSFPDRVTGLIQIPIRNNEETKANPDRVTGLIQIPIRNNEETKANIVFIHGLGGDRLLTWHCQKPGDTHWDEYNFWPGWLADDLPGFKVWLFGYESKRFFLERGNDNHLYDIARNLLGYLQAENLEQKPLWFVSHSLGGLVVKQMLRVAKDENLPMLEQVKGVVFLATPHLGSNFAKSGDILNIISLNLLKVIPSVEELQSDNAGLRDLDEGYRRIAQEYGIKTFPFYEMNSTWGVKVVDEDSANPKVHQQEFCTPVESDHIGIARCRSRDDLVYTSVKQFIEEYSTENIPFKSLTLRNIDKEEGLNNHDTIESNTIRDNQLYDALKLLNFRKQCRKISDHIPSKTTGLFLICGEKKSGTEVLLEKLYDQKAYKHIYITLAGNQGFNITIFWQRIAEILNLEKGSSPETILSKIVKIQQKQSILVVLKSIETVPPQNINDILAEFWGELIKQIPQIDTDSRNINNLFLLLVDYQNKYRNEEFCLPVDSRLFTENFTPDDIAEWIECVRSQWEREPWYDKRLDSAEAAKIFLDSQGGVPHRVYETIYGYFPLAWQSSIMINKLGL